MREFKKNAASWKSWVGKTVVLFAMLLLGLTQDAGQLRAATGTDNSDSNQTINGSKPDHPYLSAHYRLNGKVILVKPGMSRIEVDKLLGEPKVLRTREESLYQYGEVEIAYSNDRVTYINTGSGAALNAQIKYGLKWSQVVKRMGQPTVVTGNNRIYMYKMDQDGSVRKLTNHTQVKYAVGQSNVYSVWISVNPIDTVVGVSVWQDSFRVELENRRQSLQEHRPDLPDGWQLTIDELAIVDELHQVVVKLGMDKDEVDRNLGECELVQFTNVLPRCDYEGLKVYYRDDKAAGIVVSEASSSIYTTPTGIGLLSTVEHATSLYGEPYEYEGGYLTFLLEPSGDNLVPVVKEETPVSLSTERYVLSFLVQGVDPGLITYMMIADQSMAYTMN